ncbi:MAG: Ig-like domain-containing protein [Bacteroidota bacterium]
MRFLADPPDLLEVTASGEPTAILDWGSYVVIRPRPAYTDGFAAPIDDDALFTYSASSSLVYFEHSYDGLTGNPVSTPRRSVSLYVDTSQPRPIGDTEVEVTVEGGGASGRATVLIPGLVRLELTANPDLIPWNGPEEASLPARVFTSGGYPIPPEATISFSVDRPELAGLVERGTCRAGHPPRQGASLGGLSLPEAASGCVHLVGGGVASPLGIGRVAAPQGTPTPGANGTVDVDGFIVDTVRVTASLSDPAVSDTVPVRVMRSVSQLDLRLSDRDGDGIFRAWVEPPSGYTCFGTCPNVFVTAGDGLLYNPFTGEQGTTLLVQWSIITGAGLQYYPTPERPGSPPLGDEVVVVTATPATPIQDDNGDPIEGDSEEVPILQRPDTLPPNSDGGGGPDPTCSELTVPTSFAVTALPQAVYASRTAALRVTALNCAGTPITLGAETPLSVLLDRTDVGYLADAGASVPGTSYLETTVGAIESVYFQAADEAPAVDTPVAVIVTGPGVAGQTTATVLAAAEPVDLRIDSDNDGQITQADDAIENDPARLGALVAFNGDDDDGNDVPDHDDAGGFADDDLERIELAVPLLDGGTVTLRATVGEAQVRVWTDASKSQEVVLPATWAVTAVPSVLFVEGVGWNDATTVLQLTLEDGGGVEIEADTLRLYTGGLGLDIPGETEVGSEPVVVLTGLPPGESVEFLVHRNGQLVSQRQEVISNLAASIQLDLGSESADVGDEFSVEVQADEDGFRLSADPLIVVPGPPATAQVLSTVGGTADGHGTATVTVEVKDAYGNPVADGTPVSLDVLSAAGDAATVGTSALLSGSTLNGLVDFVLTAPLEGDAFVQALAPSVIGDSTLIAFSALEVELAADRDLLDVTTGDGAVLTLTTNASDGTEVFWTVSNVAEGAPSTFTTTVSGGTSTLDVSAAGADLGMAVVNATVGVRVAQTRLTYTSSAPLSAEVHRRVIAGDMAGPVGGLGPSIVTQETVVAPAASIPPEEAGDGQPRVVHTWEAPVYASTEVIVRGAQDTDYVVELDDPLDGAYVELVGLGPDGTITTDATGRATLTLRSLGTYPHTGMTDLHAVGFTVRPVTVPTARLSGDDPWTEFVYLAPQTGLAALANIGLDMFGGFFGADVDTAYGVAAAFAGGMLIVGDVGALVKNTWRGLGFSDADVNWLEVTLSGAGLLTEFAVGVGEAPDVPISALKSIVAFSGNTPFTRLLVLYFRRAAANVQDAQRLGKYLVALASKPGFLTAGRQVFTSEEAMETAIRVTDEYGDTYVDAIDNLVRACSLTRRTGGSGTELASADGTAAGVGSPYTERLAATLPPCGISKAAIRAANDVFDNAPPKLKEVLDDLAGTNPARATELKEKLARVIHYGRLEHETLVRAFSNDVFGPGTITVGSRSVETAYTAADMIDDLHTVAEALDAGDEALAGFQSLVKTIGIPGTGRMGNRYELEGAAYLVREIGGSPFFVTRKFFDDEGRQITDIDVILNGVYYQLKWSRKAFRASKKMEMVINGVTKLKRPTMKQAVVAWVEKARDLGANQVIYMSVPGGFPPSVFGTDTNRRPLNRLVQQLGISIDTYPFQFK